MSQLLIKSKSYVNIIIVDYIATFTIVYKSIVHLQHILIQLTDWNCNVWTIACSITFLIVIQRGVNKKIVLHNAKLLQLNASWVKWKLRTFKYFKWNIKNCLQDSHLCYCIYITEFTLFIHKWEFHWKISHLRLNNSVHILLRDSFIFIIRSFPGNFHEEFVFTSTHNPPSIFIHRPKCIPSAYVCIV